MNRNEASIEFLLAEFNALQAHVIKLEDAKSNRVNFFLVVVAAAVAGVSGLAGNPNFQGVFALIIAVTAFSLFLLGVTVLHQLIVYSEAVIGLYRRAGRIRRWFAEADNTIMVYLPFEASDARPGMRIAAAYLELRGGDVIIRMLNSITFAIFIVASTAIWYMLSYSLAIAGLIPLAVIIWYIQQYIIRVRLARVEEYMKHKIRFPQIDIAEATID
jgi:hypothetical protein